jgi:hypothetical protein
MIVKGTVQPDYFGPRVVTLAYVRAFLAISINLNVFLYSRPLKFESIQLPMAEEDGRHFLYWLAK